MAGTMDCLRLIPGRGIGKIADLGTTLSETMSQLQSFSSALPRIQVITNTQSRKVYIKLPDWGVSLVFDECMQLLELVSVDVSCSLPIYLNKTLIRTEVEVYREVKEGRKSQFGSNYIEKCEGLNLIYDQEFHLQFMSIQALESCSQPTSSPASATIELFPGSHIALSQGVLKLGSPSESVVDFFGLPSKVVYRAGLESCKSTDYVYNYYRAGMDFVFDGETYRLKEVQARANQPEDPLFCVYQRCQFVLHFSSHSLTPLTPESSARRLLSQVSTSLAEAAPFSNGSYLEESTVLRSDGASVTLVAGWVSAVSIWTIS